MPPAAPSDADTVSADTVPQSSVSAEAVPVPDAAPENLPPEPPAPLHRRHRRRERPRLESCPNCGHPTAATFHYCPSCGQAAKHPDASLGEIFADAWDEFVKIDSKLLKTLVPLLFRPGFLTREYMRGRRVRYITPFRLYLTISFLFFLTVTYRSTALLTSVLGTELLGQSLPNFFAGIDRRFAGASADTPLHVSVDSPGSRPKTKPSPNVPKNPVGFEIGGMKESELPETVAAYEQAQAKLPAARRDSSARQYMKRQAIGVKSRRPMDVVSDFFNTASKAMILLLPLYALLLKALYWRRGRSYIEHFVFALHIHSAFFVVASLYLLLPLPHEGLILFLALTVYGFIALRTVYQQSFFKTILKAMLLMANYSFVFLIALLITICLSIVF